MFCKAFDQAPSTPPIEVSVRLVVAAPVSIGCRTRTNCSIPVYSA
jgi:hypothetical protein